MNKIKRIVEHILRINDITIENDNRRKVYEVPEGTLYTQTRIADVYGNARAIVTVVSDDGFYSSGVNLDNIFGKRNLKCTVAGTVRIVKPLKKKWSKLLENENIEIINHSYRHLEMKDGTKIATNKAVLTHEIRDAGRWLEKWLKNKQIAFACPCNEMCELGYEILEHNNYYAVRRGARGWNSLSPQVGREKGQWFNLRIKGIVDNEADTLIRNEWVDVAIENKKWLIEMWHNVMEEDDGLFQTILIPEAEEHLDYLVEKSKDNSIWVATYTEAVKYLREKQNSKIYSYVDKMLKLHIYIELTDDKMSYETFCQPLTIFVELPNGLKVGCLNDVKISENTIMVHVVPGQECVINLIRE